ncbi:MAG TPA: NAD-dependent epimerase/dehydratase family protein [Gemmataceae bacterium]|nr:NAD-dependent epimerase/dehydratase family protein [Gemmataceae bacterium]
MVSLVTGACGFIGSHLVAELLAEQSGSVRGLVRRADSAAQLSGVDLRVGDVRDSTFVQNAVKGVDVVYHCAAAAGSSSSPHEAHDIALTGTRNVLEGLRRAGAGRAVLLTGTIVLGARHLDAAAEDLPYKRTGDPGSDVKIEIEQMAWDYEQRHAVDVTVLRPGLIYGPRDRRNLPQMIRALRGGRFAYIRSRGNVMPIVYVGDMVQAMRLAARTPAARGRAYHITDGSSTPIGEFIDCLAGLLDCPPPRKVIPFIVPYLACVLFESLAALRLYRGRAPISRTSLNYLGYSRAIDVTRARRELGYEPRISFRDGLPLALKGIELTEPEA